MREKLLYWLNGPAIGRWIAALAAASFGLRLWLAQKFLATPYHEFTLHVNGPDQNRFLLWAEGIRAGRWAVPGASPDAPFEFSPVYPWLLSLSIGFEKNPFFLIFALQAGLSCLAGLAIWNVGRRLGSGAAGAAGAVLWLLYAPSIFYDGCLIRESLLASSGFLVFWAALCAWQRPSLAAGALAGALLGFCTALRPHFFFAVVIGCFLIAALRQPDRRKWAAGIALLIASCAVIAPIAARNLLVSGRWVPVSVQGPDALILGNDPEGPGVSFVPTANSKAMLAASGGTLSGTVRTIADEFRAKPRLAVELYKRKLRMLVNAQEVRGNYSYYVWRVLLKPVRWFPLDWALLFPPACLGGWLAFRRRNRWRWAAAGALVFMAGAALIHIESRYRFAAAPFAALLAGYGVSALGGMFMNLGRDRRLLRVVVALAAVVLLALAVRPLPSFGYFQVTGGDGVTRLNRDNLLPSDYTTLLTSWMLSGAQAQAGVIRHFAGLAFRSYGPQVLAETDASVRLMQTESERFLSKSYRSKYGLGPGN